MAIDLGKLLKGALGDIAGLIPGVGPAIKDLINGIDDGIAGLSPAQRMELEKTLLDHKMTELRELMADNASFRKMATAEIQSDDAFVRRARPANLWLWIITFACWLVLFPILRGFGVEVHIPDLGIIPAQAWYTYIALFLGYGTMREIGKSNKLKHGLSPE